MRDKFMRFMQGRYGMDQFGRFIAAAALFCALPLVTSLLETVEGLL